MTFRAPVSIVLLVLTLSTCAFGQISAPAASTPLAQVQLPTYIMAGGSCNQFTGCAGFVSAIVPESNSVGLYGSVTTDISAVKIVDPVTKKTGYGLSPSVRAGQHKVVLNANKNMVTIGGDFGASFAQAGGATVRRDDWRGRLVHDHLHPAAHRSLGSRRPPPHAVAVGSGAERDRRVEPGRGGRDGMEALSHFLTANGPVLSLLALAFIVTMREELPPPLDRVPVLVWLYGWLHDALKTFVSFRSPAPKSPPEEKK